MYPLYGRLIPENRMIRSAPPLRFRYKALGGNGSKP